MSAAAEKLRRWKSDPIYFVQDQFGVNPDAWQREALEAFANKDHVRYRIALKACAGPGKTCVLAWCAWNFMACYAEPGYHPKGAAISESWDNLKDNLWTELSHWQQKSPFLTATFEWNRQRIASKQHKATWFLSARSWSKNATAEQQGQALSGLHAKYVLVLVDESGGIPLTVLQRAEQALSNCKWGRIIQAGNPTSNDGMLYAACTLLADQWKVITITGDPDDPKRSPRIDKSYAQLQINTYGRDNPWVMAYILGLFPPSAINTLVSPDEVDAAMSRHYSEDMYQYSQKRIGIDVARFGNDMTVIFPRQGLVALKPIEMRNARGPEIAARVLAGKAKWGSEIEFFDATGGYGASAVDAYLQAGQSPHEVQFAGEPLDRRYYNKRAEIWWEMAQWVKRGGALPRIPALKKALSVTTYTLKNGRIILEDKEFLKKRLGGFSPDHADALACTFALPDMPASINGEPSMGVGKTIHEHDTFAEKSIQ